jgi:hypothetical protein
LEIIYLPILAPEVTTGSLQNRNTMSRYIFITLIVLACGCDPIDKIELHNKSNKMIFYSTSVNDSITGRSPYFSTYKVDKRDTVWDESSNLLLSDSSKFLTIIGKNAWVNYINEQCKDSTLRIFVFEKGLITKVPWDTLVAKQLYTKKFAYKVRDLEKLNWQIEYK